MVLLATELWISITLCCSWMTISLANVKCWSHPQTLLKFKAFRSLSYLNTGIVTHGAFKWFLMRVFVATMTNQLSTSHKSHITVCALVWTSSWTNKKNKTCISCPCMELTNSFIVKSPLNVFFFFFKLCVSVYRCVYSDGFLAGWPSWRLFHTDDICEVSHRCGFSCVCPGWSAEGTCSYTAHTEMSSSLLIHNNDIYRVHI